MFYDFVADVTVEAKDLEEAQRLALETYHSLKAEDISLLWAYKGEPSSPSDKELEELLAEEEEPSALEELGEVIDEINDKEEKK